LEKQTWSRLGADLEQTSGSRLGAEDTGSLEVRKVKVSIAIAVIVLVVLYV
jgi:hypothetical protein